MGIFIDGLKSCQSFQFWGESLQCLTGFGGTAYGKFSGSEYEKIQILLRRRIRDKGFTKNHLSLDELETIFSQYPYTVESTDTGYNVSFELEYGYYVFLTTVRGMQNVKEKVIPELNIVNRIKEHLVAIGFEQDIFKFNRFSPSEININEFERFLNQSLRNRSTRNINMVRQLRQVREMQEDYKDFLNNS